MAEAAEFQEQFVEAEEVEEKEQRRKEENERKNDEEEMRRRGTYYDGSTEDNPLNAYGSEKH